MALYRVLVKSFINNRIVEEGEEVEYTGKPGSNLQPVEPVSEEKPARGRRASPAPAGDDDPLN